MAREAGVCNECYRNCLLLHGGKHDKSLKVATFFKVMFGKKYSEFLYVPPKHSRMLNSLVGQKSYLEDSTGQEWEVVLSDVEGCLAFNEGWNKFSIDHGIEQGDFLVFHYMMESHFVVTIYGRSGWEKKIPGERNYQNKRPKTTRKSTTRKFPSDSFYVERESRHGYGCFDAYVVSKSDTDSIPSQGMVDNLDKSFVVARNVPKAELIREPCFLTDKETTFAEDDREHLLDLSAFELPDMKSSMDMKGDKDHLFDLPTFMMNNENSDANEDHTEHQSNLHSFELPDMRSSFGRKGDQGYLSHLSTCKKTANKVDANNIGKLQGSDYSQVYGALHGGLAADASINTKKPQLGQGHAVAPSKTEAILLRSECGPVLSVSPGLDAPLNSLMPHKTIKKSDTSEPSALSGRTMRVVKQEPREVGQDLFGNLELSSKKKANSSHGDLEMNLSPTEDDLQVIQIVKPEPLDFCDPASATAIRITCSIPPENESFLELPEPLPMKQRQSMRLKMKLIFLRNPAGKLWPVIYHNKNGLTVLTSGWNAFRKANNIRPGDECAFMVDDLDKGIFHVHILNSLDSLNQVLQ